MKDEDIIKEAELYCLDKFGSKTGNSQVVDAYVFAYEKALKDNVNN